MSVIPAKRDDSASKQRLLAAAGPVFALRGFEKATLREISTAAEVNVASVAYYFGDKMGLYREVIQQVRDSRDRRFPVPNNTESDDPRIALARLVHTMLSRMLVCDPSGWETQLLMREMNQPTAVLSELVNDFFRPLFDQLTTAIRRLLSMDAQHEAPTHVVEQLALSAVGQCLYYRIGSEVVDILIPDDRREEHFDIDTLSTHITSVTIAAARNARSIHELKELTELLKANDFTSLSTPTSNETPSDTTIVSERQS